MTSLHRNHNYNIGTDQRFDGPIMAKARGRKTNVRTYPAGTTPEAAALDLAQMIEGPERVVEVREISASPDGSKRDYAIYTRPADAPVEAKLDAPAPRKMHTPTD